MSFPSPPVEVLEQLMKDPNRRPIYQTYTYGEKCAQNIMKELSELIEVLLKENSLDRFPSTKRFITSTCLNDVFIPCLQNTYKIVENEIVSQEHYIWTDDKEFNEQLVNSSTDSTDIMRNLADRYYKSITYVLQDSIPKKIMYHLVVQISITSGSKLYDKIVGVSKKTS